MKSVTATFVGDNEVLQHIIDVHGAKDSAKSQYKRSPKVRKVKKNYEESVDEREEDDAMPLGTSSAALEDAYAICGGDVYKFKTPKKSGQMAQLASEIRTPKSAMKTPKDCTPSKSAHFTVTNKDDSKNLPVRRSLRHKKPEASTPYRLQKRHGAGVLDESEDSLDSSSDHDSNDEDDDNNVTVASSSPTRIGVGKSRVSSERMTPLKSVPLTPSKSLSKRMTPLKSVSLTPSRSSLEGTTPLKSVPLTPSRRSRRKQEEIDMPGGVEEYFNIHASTAGPTSDRTLSKLEMPRLDQKSLLELLQSTPTTHLQECQHIYMDLKDWFSSWMYQMCNGFNILLYGLGSKRNLMEDFRKTMLKGFSQLVVNGYFPSLTIKHILNSITEDILDNMSSFKSPLDQYEFIKSSFAKKDMDFYLIIHNIDGVMLRNEKAQSMISLLAQVPGIHIIASLDHINSSLIWDHTKSSRLKWLWYDATTFASYTEETSYENSLLVQQSGALALSSLTHVMKSLTPNARGIFLLLTKYQLENKDNANYIGLSIQDLYQRCRESFLVNSDLTLQAQLTEFRDHKMIRSKKSFDGVEHLAIPIDAGTLTEFIEQQPED